MRHHLDLENQKQLKKLPGTPRALREDDADVKEQKKKLKQAERRVVASSR